MSEARIDMMAQLAEARRKHESRQEERDELFQLMLGRTTTKAVERILAAGYRKPRQVTTVEELKALRLPAIIDSPAGGPARVEYYAGPGRQQRYVEPLFCDDDSDTECYSPEFFATFGLPATVLLEAAK